MPSDGGVDMETEFRRCRSDLSILGSGVIVFTAWVLPKPLLIALLIPQADTDVTTVAAEEQCSMGMIFVFFFGLFLLFVLDVWLRFYIGKAARAEAAGKQRGNGYMVAAYVFFAFQAVSFVITVAQLFRSGLTEGSVLESAASLLVELSPAIIMGELAFTARKFKKLSKLSIG